MLAIRHIVLAGLLFGLSIMQTPVLMRVLAQPPKTVDNPPSAVMSLPGDGNPSADISTLIVVEFADDVGLSRSSITLQFDGRTVTPSIDCSTTTALPTRCTATYRPSSPLDAGTTYFVTISAFDGGGKGVFDTFSFHTGEFRNPAVPCEVNGLPDDDCDGIPTNPTIKAVEIGRTPATDAARKTLFVKPLTTANGRDFYYWTDFPRHLQAAGVPFAKLGIEIVVISDPKYNPADDPEKPPCDILEIIYDEFSEACPHAAGNSGHPYYASGTWTWDTLGFTANLTDTGSNKAIHGYYRAEIYAKPIVRYFKDGYYQRLYPGATPGECADGARPGTAPCCWNSRTFNAKTCWGTTASTMNIDLGQSVDKGVEFNSFSFSAGKIANKTLPAKATEYSLDQVIQRLIAHEMGHAMLLASSSDHCSNPDCIMYGAMSSGAGWSMKDFGGSGACTHGAGGSKHIGDRGFVHNRPHRQ